MFVCMSRFYVNRLGPFVDFLSNENNLDVSVLSKDERRISSLMFSRSYTGPHVNGDQRRTHQR